MKKEKVKGTPADLDKNQMEDHVHKYHPNSITEPPSRSRPILNNENREATPIAADPISELSQKKELLSEILEVTVDSLRLHLVKLTMMDQLKTNNKIDQK